MEKQIEEQNQQKETEIELITGREDNKDNKDENKKIPLTENIIQKEANPSDSTSPDPKKKLLCFEEKQISIAKLYYSLSESIDIFYMILGTIGSLGAGVAMPLFSILFGRTLSGYGAEQNATPSKDLFEMTIGSMVRNFLIVGACVFVAYFLQTSMWTLVGLRQLHKMKELYFRIILKQEQGFFDSSNAYEFSTKVQAQIKQVEGGLGDKFGLGVMMFSQIITGLVIALTTSWKLTLVLLSVGPLLVVSVIFMAKAMKNGMILSRKAYEKAGGIAEEVLYNIKTVASFANFDYEIDRFKKNIEECKSMGVSNGLKLGLGMGALFFFMFSTYCIAIIYGSRLIVSHEWNSNAGRVFQAGDVLTVIMSTVMAVATLGGIAPVYKSISEACVAASDFFTLQERIPQIDTSTSTQKPEKETITGRIELKNVSFAYPSKPDLKILKNIDIDFEPGKKIALVGESGSGKSTIVNLLERLYDFTEGSITIDGINIKDFDVNYLRSLIGYVQQEPVLFNKSIKENIIFGRDLDHIEDIDTLIQEACEDAHANEFIKKIPEKYNYLVGIKGSKLSGGQKQRVAIARAILTKPKILLLDEATSALDNKSEKDVQKALDKISQKHVTTIIIAHRLTTIKNADKIYAIKEGRVMESGTHRELLDKNGYYAGLVKSQMNEDEKSNSENNQVERVKSIQILKSEETARLNLDKEEDDVVPIEDTEKNKNVEAEKKQKIDRMKILSLLSDNKCNLLLASFGSASNGAIFPIYGLILASAINSLSNPNMKIVEDEGTFMGLMFLIIAFFAGTGYFFQNYKFTQIGEILTAKLRNLVFEKYLRLHLSYFDRNENSPGALLTKLSIDTSLLNGIVLTVVGISVQSLVCFSLGIAFGFAYDYRLSLICLAFFPFIIMSSFFQQKVRKGHSKSDDKLDIEAGSILSECVINTKTIFSFNFKDKAVEMYLEILSSSKAMFTRQSLFVAFFYSLGQFCLFAAYATLFFAGGKFIIGGTLTYDNMTRAIMSILFSAFGIGSAQQYAGDFAKAENAFASLFSTLNLVSQMDTTEEANKDKKSADFLSGKIEFRDVVFAYPLRPGLNVLSKINFTILPGQSVAFVGASGSGKSTIVQLIERFYDIQEGLILIDDVDIKEYNLLQLRRKIGLVSQEPCLFNRSVKENIHYGNFAATDKEIKEAAHSAHILKFFTDGDDGTKNTPVSGGEKQRIAIARAFLKNPKILLLDEATSALDKDSENEVQKALNALQGGRTSITIAHRLSTIENCDVIYVLESGRIVESGSHHKLYEMKGKYYTLHKYSSQP